MYRKKVITKTIPAGMRINLGEELQEYRQEILAMRQSSVKGTKKKKNPKKYKPQPEEDNWDLVTTKPLHQNEISDDSVISVTSSESEFVFSEETEKKPEETERKPERKMTFKDKLRENLRRSLENQQRKNEHDCKNCDKFVNCPNWRLNNVEFRDSNITCQKSDRLFRSSIFENQPEIVKLITNKNFLHGLYIHQVFSLDEIDFNNSIKKSLKKHNFISPNNLQSFMWPTVARGFHSFIIGPHNSGKTFSYLPILTSLLMEKHENSTYSGIIHFPGPFFLIICDNNNKCVALRHLIRSLVGDSLVVDSEEPNCDILVTTPEDLENRLKLGSVKLKRLCYFAMEDAHLILKEFPEITNNLFKIMDLIYQNRPDRRKIQMIFCSEKWSRDLETIFTKLFSTPWICFEDFLEAALYSKIEFKNKSIQSVYKLFYLVDILRTTYMSNKTIVFCKENDIKKNQEFLQTKGIEIITISENLTEDEIFENEEMWCAQKIGSYKVLLCTDAMFKKTKNILNAQWLVHLDAPQNGDHWPERFRSMAGNFRSPLVIDGESDICRTNGTLVSWMVVDESSKNEFEIFFDVLLRSKLKKINL